MWKAYPKFGAKDRIYLASGPVGLALLLVDWRLGLLVLLVAVPILHSWKQREFWRAMDNERGTDDLWK
jgi:hypothetical protein